MTQVSSNIPIFFLKKSALRSLIFTIQFIGKSGFLINPIHKNFCQFSIYLRNFLKHNLFIKHTSHWFSRLFACYEPFKAHCVPKNDQKVLYCQNSGKTRSTLSGTIKHFAKAQFVIRIKKYAGVNWRYFNWRIQQLEPQFDHLKIMIGD